MKHFVPNKSILCNAINAYMGNIDGCIKRDNIKNTLLDSIKGRNQHEFYGMLIKDGYIINPSSKKDQTSLNNYIDRCQKNLRIKDYANIYYGRIGKHDEFGYYLQIKD